MHVTKSSPSEKSLIPENFSPVQYSDSFTTAFKSNRSLHVDDLVYAFFDTSPKWIEKLFILRNAIVKMLGLKVSEVNDRKRQRELFKVEKGNSLGLFKVFDKSENEALLGEDDKHLDFRILFHLINKGDNHYVFTLTTPVRFHNAFGRFYFTIIKPFHQFIVPAMMKNIIKKVTTDKN
ncbi:conserved hypothetical protein [Sporocytophaga myxococcoides]|uniref:DUF2867 domain-containing protein n=1 Tax=Sporocytophaga myxococcoides TaxID=153721 RepID=A0A098LCW7_9BACT|nr:DUF2867 domain-containing protein [Sporocytophaga myxococcoides]GAL84736.1 conserved hypothetical protein [Sporocytophaga myxococcoides]